MKKEKLLFEIIVSRQCNKRCPYCDLDFSSDFITRETLNDTIAYILSISGEINSLSINFFGGEPLLAYDQIKYFVLKIQEYNISVTFSIGTNGVLLDKEKINFFKKYNFNIYLSIDTETGMDVLKKDIFHLSEDIFKINFILNPNTIFLSYGVLKKVIEKGFSNINLMPVFGTIDWGKEDLKALNKFVKFSRNFEKKALFGYYSYFNDVSIEKQFMIEVDGKVYSDLDSLLWIQRQNHNIIPKDIIEDIHKKTFIGNIATLGSLPSLLDGYNIKEILKLVFSIPKVQGNSKVYEVIDIIMKQYR